MTHHVDAALVFFVLFFAALGGLLTGLYFLEATLDRPENGSRRR